MDAERMKSNTKTNKKKHHAQSKFCFSRPNYREARWERAVKVFTINQESKYLLVQGIPSVGICKELIELFAIYGPVEEYRYLADYPAEEFTDVYWIKFQKIQAARFAKKKLDMRSFYGGVLHVCYAPEFESINDTREKLRERRQQIARKCREYFPNKEMVLPQERKDCTPTADISTNTEAPLRQSFVPCFPDTNTSSLDQEYSTSSKTKQKTLPFPESPFPDLPLPPVHLPYHLHPPPPPSTLEYPRISTKHATLPENLRSGDVYNVESTVNALTSNLALQTTASRQENNSSGWKSNPVCVNRSNLSDIHDEKRSFTGDSQHPPISTNTSLEKGKSVKRIVWHKQPMAALPPQMPNHLSDYEPGAWDPFAESRKKLKSLTGDQNLDTVALNIREKLKRIVSATQQESSPEKKKQRKRI